MQFQSRDIFHIYNRGNNKQPIFFSDSNYEFFLTKIRHYITPVCDVLAYCLMPNHFHLLVQANEVSARPKKIAAVMSTELNNGVRMLQSTYANAINKQQGLTGSLFQQKTKFKLLSSSHNLKHDDLQCCFHYIHQNPMKAGFVDKMESWKYSSFNEYLSETANSICNMAISKEILDLPQHLFYKVQLFCTERRSVKEYFLILNLQRADGLEPYRR